MPGMSTEKISTAARSCTTSPNPLLINAHRRTWYALARRGSPGRANARRCVYRGTQLENLTKASGSEKRGQGGGDGRGPKKNLRLCRADAFENPQCMVGAACPVFGSHLLWWACKPRADIRPPRVTPSVRQKCRLFTNTAEVRKPSPTSNGQSTARDDDPQAASLDRLHGSIGAGSSAPGGGLPATEPIPRFARWAGSKRETTNLTACRARVFHLCASANRYVALPPPNPRPAEIQRGNPME